jgi:ATP-dependent RNA helicase DeaD
MLSLMEPTPFADRPLLPALKTALQEAGFTVPTPVQAASFEVTTGDLMVQARTGSGKTLAFGLPILEKVDAAQRLPQALVLAPTRELALQIAKAISPFARAVDARCIALTGGADVGPQIKALHSPRGAQMVVGTPGRVLDLIERGHLVTTNVKTVVLDEGDHLLDLGFKDELDAILGKVTNPERRTLLFSATIPPEVEALAKKHAKHPKKLVIDSATTAHADIEHVAYAVPHGKKAEALANILFFEQPERTVVFCGTRNQARELSERLPLLGIPAGLISGELDQVARNRALDAFREGRCHVLVATDVAARGIDVPATTHVIHFDLGETPEAYVHRSGRTGRAGRKGVSLSLVTQRERGGYARQIRLAGAGIKVAWRTLPGPDGILRQRIERLAAKAAEASLEEPSPYAVEHANKLANATPPEKVAELITRLLTIAAEAEGSSGFALEEAIRKEAAPGPRKSRDDRKVPRQERWARRATGAPGGHRSEQRPGGFAPPRGHGPARGGPGLARPQRDAREPWKKKHK